MPSRPTNGGSTVKGTKRNRRYIAATIAALGATAAFAASANAVTLRPSRSPSPTRRPQGITRVRRRHLVRGLRAPGGREDHRRPRHRPSACRTTGASGPAQVTVGPTAHIWATGVQRFIVDQGSSGSHTGRPSRFVTGSSRRSTCRASPREQRRLWFVEPDSDNVWPISTATSGAQGGPLRHGACAEGHRGRRATPTSTSPPLPASAIVKQHTAPAATTQIAAARRSANGITVGPDGNLWVTSDGGVRDRSARSARPLGGGGSGRQRRERHHHRPRRRALVHRVGHRLGRPRHHRRRVDRLRRSPAATSRRTSPAGPPTRGRCT